MKKFRITLRGTGGILDMKTFEVRADQDEDAIRNALIGYVSEWTLSAGDKIEIEEVP